MRKFTVAFFALGSALKFDESKVLRSDGSSEYLALAKLLLRNKSIEKIVLLSKSDLARISPQKRAELDPEGKLFNPYEAFPQLRKFPRMEDIPAEEWPNQFIGFTKAMDDAGVKCDFGVGFTSQGHAVLSLGGYLWTVRDTPEKPRSKAKCLSMSLRYAADPVYYLGSHPELNWWLLATDPRYVKPSMRHRDNANLPKKVLGQHDFDIKWHTIKKLNPDALEENGDFHDVYLKSEYSGIEKMNLMGEGVLDPEKTEKPNKFTIVSMQVSLPSATEDLRYDILKEYIIDRDPEGKANIYGKWNDYFKKDHVQFKGYIATEDLDKTFADTRYTLVLPTEAGWVTSKYAEMLQLAVVPFLHPRYDTQYHIVPKDHFIRVKDADDFYKKMEYLDANPNKRIALVKDLQNGLIKEAFTGKFMIDLLNKQLDEYNYDNRLDDSEESLWPLKEKVITVPQKDVSLDQFFA